ncbi:MAG: hypothetical protein LBC68_06845 [Prevotellaceae bacterium]|jgi:hypothetical protein|nr:hypothetical protein [Prevotellaceae bacterium]
MLVEKNTAACMSRELLIMFPVNGNASREQRIQRFFYQHSVPTERHASRHCEERSDEATEAKRSSA